LIYRQATQQVEILKSNGIWLGLLDNIAGMNTEHCFNLAKGDCLLLYTDGVTEAENRGDSFGMYGDKRLVRILREHGHKSAQAIVDAILADLADFIFVDDATLFAIKRR